jgi:hypothetical protein
MLHRNSSRRGEFLLVREGEREGEATLLISMHGTAELRRNRMAAQLVERCRAVQ